MRLRAAHTVGWGALVALLVLITRWLCYALAPQTPLASRLEHTAGGPQLAVVTLVSLGLALAVSTATLWLVALGVRERARLRPERVPPSLRPVRLGLRALGLFVTSSLAFALFESYLHWRAGIGFHGLSCLVGPVHRNAIPLLTALAVLAAALAEAGSHVLAWARAAVRELLRTQVRLATTAARLALPPTPLVAGLLPRRARARAPPLPA